MNKLLWLFFICGLTLISPVQAGDVVSADVMEATVGNEKTQDAVSDVLSASEPEAVVDVEEMVEDDAEIEIEPLNIALSDEERQQEDSTPVDFIEDVDVLPDLPCSDVKLREQVKQFIYQNISSKTANSAIERRQRVLLVQNLHEFEEIKQEDIKGKDGFNAQAVLMNLRINQHREITHICASKENQYNKFNSVYVVIYPFANLYRVVVTNLMETTDNYETATFVYNW